MHGEEGHAPAAQVGDGAPHGFGDIVELEVAEHPVAPFHQPVEQFVVAAGGGELEADLVEAHRITELFDQRSRIGGRRYVERND